VVVGTFNIYILHPHWLAKHGLIEKGTGVLMETNVAQAGFRFRMPKDRVTWRIAPTQIAVETEVPEVDCGAIIATVLDALPETPLFGLGNNAVYAADLTALDALPEHVRKFPQCQSAGVKETVVQRTFHVGLKHDEHRFTNLQISIEEEGIELLHNVHTELRDRDTRTAAIPAAKMFFEDRETAKDLMQRFLGTGIEYGTSNHGT
jgi:hypothetical protein